MLSAHLYCLMLYRALKWIGKDSRFAERLVAFAVVEGIFFSGAASSPRARDACARALGPQSSTSPHIPC